MRDVVPIYLHLPPREIAYVKFVFESYEVGRASCGRSTGARRPSSCSPCPTSRPTRAPSCAALAAEGACEETEAAGGLGRRLARARRRGLSAAAHAWASGAATVEDAGRATR